MLPKENHLGRKSFQSPIPAKGLSQSLPIPSLNCGGQSQLGEVLTSLPADLVKSLPNIYARSASLVLSPFVIRRF
jgi:hypothetical protein